MSLAIRFRAQLAWDWLRARVGVPLGCERGGAGVARDSQDGALTFTVGSRDALLCYGRPSTRGRTVFGDLVPFGELWRTGANEPTVLQLSFNAEVAGLRLARGKYSLYTVPSRADWTIVINRATRQWGLTRPERGKNGRLFESAYTPAVRAAEVGRVPVETGVIPHVERLTARAEHVDDCRTDLLIEWETIQVRIPVRRV